MDWLALTLSIIEEKLTVAFLAKKANKVLAEPVLKC